MSELKVEVTKILKVETHPNADRLDLVTVFGWQCVTGKDAYKEGDKVVYIPIDSILPSKVETALFPPDSKIKLDHSRVRTTRIRKAISQGMVASLSTLGLDENLTEGTDVAKDLGITKYEPPANPSQVTRGQQKKKRKNNPNFHKYTDIQNIKFYSDAFAGKEVVITEKIHGTNWRAGKLPFHASTWWERVKGWFRLNPKEELVFGSHNVELTKKIIKRVHPSVKVKPTEDTSSKDIYSKMVEQYDIANKIELGIVLYGEAYGDGVQKNYKYGCGNNEHKLVIFDVMYNGKYLDTDAAMAYCEARGLSFVPVLYRGVFTMDVANKLVGGNSVLCPAQKVREGIVIKLAKEEQMYLGRGVLKYINPEYLLDTSNTDNH